MSYVLTKILATVFIIAAGGLGLWYARKSSPPRGEGGAQRLPTFFKIAAWIILALGLVIFLVALDQGVDKDIAMTIAGGGISLLGILFLVAYHNFWVLAEPYMVRWRTFFGTQKQIAAAEVTEVSAYSQGVQTFIRIVSPTAKLELNPRMYNLQPFLDTVDRRVFK